MDKGCDNEPIDNSEKHPMEQINDIIKQTTENLEKEEINETKDENKDENKGETNDETKDGDKPDIEKGKIDDIQIVEEDIIFGFDDKENNEENKEDKEEKTEEELQKEFINSIDDK